MHLTPIGSEFESIIAAVVFFLLGGFVSFTLCFCATNCYLCYKRRIIKRHRYSVDDFDYTVLTADNNSMVSPNEVVVVDAGRLQKSHTYAQPKNKQKRASDASSLSTSSTNETWCVGIKSDFCVGIVKFFVLWNPLNTCICFPNKNSSVFTFCVIFCCQSLVVLKFK